MTAEKEQLQQEIIRTTDARMLPEKSFDAFTEKLEDYIRELINHDFAKLVYILYRLDVSEQKLKDLLAARDSDAGTVIAHMIIERQMEKINTRRKYKNDGGDIPEDQKW